MTRPVGLGEFRDPQAPVVEGGVGLDPIIPGGVTLLSPERLAPGSLSTRAASKSDRSSGSPTLATGSVRRQSLCNPLLLWRHFNMSQSSLGSCSARFSCFHKAFSSGSSVMRSTSCPGCVFTCMSSVAGVLLGREFTVFRCSLLWRERRWVVAASGGGDVTVRRCVAMREKTHILNVRYGRAVGQLREVFRFPLGNGMLLFNCPAGIQWTRGEDFASC